MFGKVLIANRGEIAGRIGRTLRRMGVRSVAIFSDADRFTRPVMEADEAIRIGPAPAAASYLDVAAVLEACRRTGAEAVHPGYGFLSENVAFAEALGAAGIVFIGPRPEHLRAFGLKHTARALAQANGLTLLPGSDLLDDPDAAVQAAASIGYPVMLKSTAGGGGIGMQLCDDEATLRARFDEVQRAARASFGDARVYLERFVADARHVEVQVFGDGRGRVVALGERDCSLQRRNQKVIEETPAPGLSAATRERLHLAAMTLAESVDYASAGTVEFIFGASYLVMGLGDVYLGAPVATPVDPRYRLVTTKYNPARTWTPENAVGIGGAYLCIYGMEGPGGYQLFGRTIQVWNIWRSTSAFASGQPWLLRNFDQIRFEPVSPAELTEARAAFPHGAYPLRIEKTQFSYAQYAAELTRNAGDIAAAKQRQQAAFDIERRRWKAEGLDVFVPDERGPEQTDGEIPAGCFGVFSAMPGNIWKVLVAAGAVVVAGDAVAIIESMKMEIRITTQASGRVREIRAVPGRIVRTGDLLAVLEEV